MREANKEADAQVMLRYARDLFSEPGLNIPVAAGEFQMSLDEERDRIAQYRRRNWVFLLAFSPAGELVGMLECPGSDRRALRHSCDLTISVPSAHRGGASEPNCWPRRLTGRGVAALSDGSTVYVRNEGAIRLCERFDFQVEGRRRRAVFQKGQYLDDLALALLL